ncbi:MAG: hypothetical protein JW700_03595, partial [Candidatus Aenigmarchaeota archaeon]|nr:hypothetical protein [Candidatus Aenigmarchaeota archaeon]
RMLEHNGFEILRSDFFCNKECLIVLEMKEWKIPKVWMNVGPDVFSRHAEEFIKHYQKKKVFIENDNWVVELEREFTNTVDFLKNIFNKKEKTLKEMGIPSKIAPKLNNAKLLYDKSLENKIKDSKEMRIFLKEWFEKDLDVV